jgi:hypothetical protein
MAEEYFYKEYPKYMCHPDGRWTEVHDKNEEGHMQGEGFVFSPSEYGVETAPAAPQVHQGGFRQPGYVSPSSLGGSGGRPDPQHVAAQQAASQAEARRLQAEAEGRGESSADQAAQAEVAKLQEEAKQREEARQRSEEASRQGQPPDPGRSTPRRG